MKNRIIKTVSLILVAAILFSVFSTVCLAEENSDNTVNQTNANILNELLSDIDMDGAYTFNCEYDSNGRIIKVLCRSGSVETIYNYTYTGNTYECSVTTSEVAELLSEDVELFTSLSGDDLKITNASIKNRIEQAKALWNEADKNGDEVTKERAHLEARIARADYCVLYPKSDFAYTFLETGELFTNTAFRRELKLNDTGNDVLVLQRALMYYDYMDELDLPDANYGIYDSITKDAVSNFQEKNFGKFSENGIANASTLTKLFTPSNSLNNMTLNSFSTMAGFTNINLFRERHNAVRDIVAARVGGIIEAYVAQAGLRSNGGFVDVVQVQKPISNAWEIKPKSTYGISTGARQLQTYIDKSYLDVNQNHEIRGTYCPLQSGYKIEQITWKYSPSITLVIKSDENNYGVVYYETLKNDQKVRVPVVSPSPQEEKEREKVKITAPDPEVVVGGLTAAGLVVVGFYVVKGIIAISLAAPTGGVSLAFAF